jgi:hypothetical protein
VNAPDPTQPTEAADPYADIPEALRFDLDERPTEETVRFALGDHILTASKPLEYTMLLLGSAMSGMSDGGDRAYAIMGFCHDAFDGPTRELVKNLPGDRLLDLIESLCEHWGSDTSNWNREQANNRAERRAAKKPATRRR